MIRKTPIIPRFHVRGIEQLKGAVRQAGNDAQRPEHLQGDGILLRNITIRSLETRTVMHGLKRVMRGWEPKSQRGSAFQVRETARTDTTLSLANDDPVADVTVDLWVY